MNARHTNEPRRTQGEEGRKGDRHEGYSQVRPILPGDAYIRWEVVKSQFRAIRDLRCSPEMRATLRFRYSSGEGRLSFSSGENGVGTSGIWEEVDMVVESKNYVGYKLSDGCLLYILADFANRARSRRGRGCRYLDSALLTQEQGQAWMFREAVENRRR